MRCLLLTVCLLPSLAFSQVWHWTEIDIVYPFDEQTFVLGITNESDSCSNPNGFYRVQIGQNGVTEKHFQRLYAAALAAAAQQSRVRINYLPDAVQGQCWVNRFLVSYQPNS